MYDGRFAGEVSDHDTEKIGLMMTGGHAAPASEAPAGQPLVKEN
jgi:hypothetical protein